ncbi:MAG TPA: YCF48-related protein [Melioribacteraceae bacterium]|nr:YCF48-related protein [Melioribacteraceae bacterium]
MKKTFLLFIVLSTILNAEEWVVKHQDVLYYLTSVHFTDKNNGIAVGGGNTLVTSDGGDTWVEVDTMGVYTWTKVSGPPKSNIIYGCGPNGQIGKYQNGIFTSFNSGTTKMLSGVAFATENTGYVVGQDGTLLKTTNGGLNWNPIASGTTEWLNNVAVNDTDAVVIIGDNGLVRQSTDGGNSFTTINVPGINTYLGDIAFVGNNNFWVCGSEGSLFNVTPSGNNIINTGSNDGIMGLAIPVPNFGVGVGDNGAIYEFNGTDWTRQNSPTTAWLNDVTSEPDSGKGNITLHFWAVGENGIILKKTVSVVNVSEDKLPNSFFVSQNFPNPFNPSTKFNYSVPFVSQVLVELYNSLGEKISIIKNEINDIGTYNISIEGKDLSSGVYFVKFSFNSKTDFKNSFSTIKKIMLIK